MTMKSRFNQIHLSLFGKALAIFLLVMLPVQGLGIALNIWGQDNVRREQLEASRVNLLLYFSGMEYEFRNPLRLQLNLLNHADMIYTASAAGKYNDVEYFRAVNSVRGMLKDIKDSSALIDEVDAYLPAKGRMLSTKTGFVDLPDDYEQLRRISQLGKYPFFEYNGQLLCCISTDSLTTSDLNSFLVLVRFSKQRIAGELLRQGNVIGSSAALVSTGNGITLGGSQSLTAALGALAAAHTGHGETSGSQTLRADGQDYLVTWARSDYLQTMIAVYTPRQQVSGLLSYYSGWIIVLSVLSALSLLMFSLWMRRIVITPVLRLLDAFRSLESGNFNVQLDYRQNDDFGVLYARSNEMIARLGNLIEQVYEQKIRTSEAELKQLQYQINPHFLYNSLLIAANLIKMTDYDCAARLVRYLGNYYLYLTKGADFVPFSKEVGHASDYIEIQSIRFADRFSCQFDEIPEALGNRIVPRLILQPIIENAFKYGLANTVSGGMLRIGIAGEADAYVVQIEDNGSGLDDDTIAQLNAMLDHGDVKGPSTGLLNVHRRLQIAFGRSSGLTFSRSALGGLRVQLRIAIQEEDAHV